MNFFEKKAWENVSVLDPEFDEWEYGQEVEQRYRSKYGTYGTLHTPGQGKIDKDYQDEKRSIVNAIKLEQHKREEHLIDKIFQATSEVTDVSINDLLSNRHAFSTQRQIAMYIAVETTGLSYPRLGKLFGRDHSTIMYGAKKIKELQGEYYELDKCVSDILEKLKGRS